jgi:phosphatidylcholine synthase
MMIARRVAAMMVHAFTATGGAIGLFTLAAIHEGNLQRTFWLMASAVIVDSIDGTFARLAKVEVHARNIDGAMMDNILDYLNYVVAPAYLLLQTDLVPAATRASIAVAIMIASAIQFSQRDAKTADHFFKGFPCYWNIAVFHMALWSYSATVNLVVLIVLVSLVFVPIKYVYPTRLENFSQYPLVRNSFLVMTVLWVAILLWMLASYPHPGPVLMTCSLAYCSVYFVVSLWCTWRAPATVASRTTSPHNRQ